MKRSSLPPALIMIVLTGCRKDFDACGASLTLESAERMFALQGEAFSRLRVRRAVTFELERVREEHLVVETEDTKGDWKLWHVTNQPFLKDWWELAPANSGFQSVRFDSQPTTADIDGFYQDYVVKGRLGTPSPRTVKCEKD